ncbi:hypothetical protein DevBK_19610 [Devosia sp. BK]|uniref:hypothetical protein n=1 Tax=Devosia sp. BK TaxID=2871706 RepID=UPI0029397D2C|nr:hypothetical protein [Devosia sp. BK]MDV3253552.1 hypothetical protein [Devosia sp. BK]
MAVNNEIEYTSVDQLMLDPLNPRLGRGNTGPTVKQSTILNLMRDWTLDELAVSFLESGFWPQEALIVVREKLYGKDALVVIEGNRRLAALKFLQRAADGEKIDRRWREIIEETIPPADLFERVPYIEVETRKDVEAFLGFRHVTGIKEWKPAEKAEYIAKLIENSKLTYAQVMRKIGSKTPTVRQNYISYRLLLQMEGQEKIAVEYVEDKFSVLFLSLRTDGVQRYLDIDIQADPDEARKPVPDEKLKELANFALWLFGDEKRQPIVRDSRQVDQFGRVLLSKKAVEYLERSPRPSFEVAFSLAGGDEPEIIRLVEEAADNVESALSRAHRYAKSKKLRKAAQRLGEDALQLASLFAGLRDELNADKDN